MLRSFLPMRWFTLVLLLPLTSSGCDDAPATPTAVVPDVEEVTEVEDDFDAPLSFADLGQEDTVPDTTEALPEGCCTSTTQCEEGMVCGVISGVGHCVPALKESECFIKEHCLNDYSCEGAFACGCEEECETPTTPGTCTKIPVVDPSCCSADTDCPNDRFCLGADLTAEPPVLGRCAVHPTPGAEQCWTAADCAAGGSCEGPQICNCNSECTSSGLGSCDYPPVSECTTNADCGAGSCYAAGDCTDLCAAGDPSCCNANICLPYRNECDKDADCGDGQCLPGDVCYPWCPEGDPSCCFGSVCEGAKECAGSNPQGCLATGCPTGASCIQTEGECIPTICTCDTKIGSWSCSDDCHGGACEFSVCPGTNPQGCATSGCPAGQVCTAGARCVPSACACDTATLSWTCSADCSGGECVPE